MTNRTRLYTFYEETVRERERERERCTCTHTWIENFSNLGSGLVPNASSATFLGRLTGLFVSISSLFSKSVISLDLFRQLAAATPSRGFGSTWLNLYCE